MVGRPCREVYNDSPHTLDTSHSVIRFFSNIVFKNMRARLRSIKEVFSNSKFNLIANCDSHRGGSRNQRGAVIRCAVLCVSNAVRSDGARWRSAAACPRASDFPEGAVSPERHVGALL